MSWIPKIHFEISERKILLRVFDLASITLMLILVYSLFHFDYLKIRYSRWGWILVLWLYYTVFAAIFELYDLQKAASFQTTLKNVLLTVSTTVLFFILTPFVTPVLPDNRLQNNQFFMGF